MPGDATAPGPAVEGGMAIDHLAIAVNDLEAAIVLYRRAFGAVLAYRETVPEQGVEEALLAAGGSFVQLLRPLGPDTPVGRFLQARGEGLHHVGYRVASVERAMEAARAAGMRLIDQRPRRGSRGTRIAFVHPKGALGTLVELVEVPK